jgi:hypothetical protein
MRQVLPLAHWASLEQRSRQVPSTQSALEPQSPAFEQLPVGRGRHSPPWHDSVALQSESALQP